MAVTPDNIAVELGRPTPLDATTTERWQSWIDRTLRAIERRAVALDVDFASLDPGAVDDVVLLAVAEHARNPDGVDTYDVSIDDGRESRRYRHSSGRIVITDDLWATLFPEQAGGVFSVRLVGEPDATPVLTDWT